ncbi:MAG: LamG domain-containing protein, partial [archaeon]
MIKNKRGYIGMKVLIIALSMFAIFLAGYALAAVSIPAGIFNSYTTANGMFTNVTNVSNNAALLSYGGSPYDTLVGYWSFDADNSTTARDLSGRNYDGVYTNGALSNSSSGLYGNGLFLDGTNDYVNISSSVNTGSALKITGNFAISVWFRPSSFSNYNMIVTKAPGEGSGSYELRTDQGTGKARIGCIINSVNANFASTSALTLNNWTFLTAVYNGTGLALYINGIYDNSTAASGNLNANTDPVQIGNRGSGNYLANGFIDEVMIFNSSLSAGQIAAIYANTSARFKSPGTIDFGPIPLNSTYDNVTVNVVGYSRPSGSNISAQVSWWNSSLGYDLTGFNTTGLVSLWRMDDLNASGGLVDYMGRNNGTVVGGAVQNSSGMFGKSMSFDGITGAVETGFVNNLTSNFTVSLWMNGADFTSGTGYRTILTGKNGASYRVGSFYIGWRGGLFGIGRGG